MSFSNDFSTLRTAAEAYFYLGWSVIPLHGDLDSARPKVPTISWTYHQHCCASLNDQRNWNDFAGLGIVTGRVSQLVVLDFDNENLFQRFKIQYPDLTETRTIRSAGRQLPHLYFKLPDHLHLTSHKGQGIDILSDGCYVVAPPTTINGSEYKITRGGMPKPLTERDLHRIQAFIAANKIKQPQAAADGRKHPTTPPPNTRATSQDLTNIYNHHCQHAGRNEALFLSSLFARDTGWSHAEAQTHLVPLHVQQAQPSETTAQRQREATATIRSAFSRPPKRNRSARQATTAQLPNSVREKLMHLKMTYLIRTLEGLLLQGLKLGQVIHTRQAVDALKGLVGRDSVHHALQATVNGQILFNRVSPANPLQNANAVATSSRRLNNKKCFLLETKTQEKINRGRPQHAYRIPDITDLCRILDVKATLSDPLDRTDLAHAHLTRMALHRELIKRHPGQYSRRWLANRLGVTMSTIDAYNRNIPIHSKPCHLETVMNWNTIERLPVDEPLQGAYLITAKEKRYPALRIIASKLLAKGTMLRLKQQQGNIYWYGDAEPITAIAPVLEAQPIQHKHQPIKPAQPIPESHPETFSKPLQHSSVSKHPPVNAHKPLSDNTQEARAQQLYTTINRAGQKTLSIANARRLTLKYEPRAVNRALARLATDKTPINPIGLLITLLRGSQIPNH